MAPAGGWTLDRESTWRIRGYLVACREMSIETVEGMLLHLVQVGQISLDQSI